MKQTMLGLTFVLAAGAAATARAERVVDADVTFPFTAGRATLPAGHYVVQTSDRPEDSVLFFRDRDTGKTTVVEYVTRSTEPDEKASQSELLFDERGTVAALREIHRAGEDAFVVPVVKTKAQTSER
jgi:hypothetical protein